MADLVFSRPQTHNPELVFGERDDVPVEPVDSPGALVFSAPQTHSAALVFGERGDTPEPGGNATVDFVAELPGLFASVGVRMGIRVEFAATLPEMFADVQVRYVSNTARPVVSRTTARWQAAKAVEDGVVLHWHDAQPTPARVDAPWQDGVQTQAGTTTHWRNTDHSARPETHTRYEDGVRVRASAGVRYQEANRSLRPETRTRWQDGRRMRAGTAQRFHDALRDRRTWTHTRWQDAKRVANLLSDSARNGIPFFHNARTRYQDGMRPPVGRWVRPVVPPGGDPCYVPSAELLFAATWSADANLVFICERHGPGPQPGETVVVPVKEVYMIVNSATLVRVDGSVLIPTLSMSMSLDVDSWNWSFNASVPGRALSDLEPNSAGDPVEVEATINGVAYRFLVESIGRERGFNASSLRISGRGKAAGLDAPYAPVMNFLNAEARTAQQLMGDVLTINGVPLGWAVDWQLLDWNVPGGVFSHQGSYITALNAIVSAAGGYLQPHNTDQQFRVLARYPTPAWEWASVTPNYELPSDVTTRETIDWVEKPRYNRVYVSGQAGGVLGRYTRAGSAGDLLAQPVVDQLVTGANAVRQRGRAILSDTGRIATVGLRLPVLETTGIIPPGKFVRYVDEGVTRLGLTRGVAVDCALPTVWQNITVETHV